MTETENTVPRFRARFAYRGLAGFALAALLLLPALSPQAQLDSAQPPAAVNINTADAETLARQLDGVGLARAEEIIRYRETFGPFASVEELEDVKGIGKSTLERNRAVITLD